MIVRRPRNARSGFDWPAEHDEKLIEFCKSSMSYREIAAGMSAAFPQVRPFTRNMVLGRANRLGLRSNKPRKETHAERKARGWKTGRQARVRPPTAPLVPMEALSPETEADMLLRANGARGDGKRNYLRKSTYPAEIAKRKVGRIPDILECEVIGDNSKPLLDASYDCCKWPVAESEALMVCGEKATIGSYCTKHAQLSYRTMPTIKRNRAVRAGAHGKLLGLAVVEKDQPDLEAELEITHMIESL